MQDIQCVLFDPRLGSEETAERKILYYHPSFTPLDEQVKAVGFCEAVTNFITTFTSDNCESVHTQRGRQVYLHPEPHLWLVLLVPHPSSGVKPSTAAAAAAAEARAAKDAECEELPPAEEALQDGALQALLRRVYATLRMACGYLTTVADERGVDGLRSLLAQVMPLLLKLELSGVEEDASRLDLLDTIEGMRFLPVERRLYLRVQYLANLLLTRHACVRHVVVMHADQLVWSSLTRNATQQLHRYLVSTVAAPPPPAASKAERLQLNTAALPDEALAIGIALVQRQLRTVHRPPPAAGCFVCGAADSLQDMRSAVRVPCVHIEAQPGCVPPPDAAASTGACAAALDPGVDAGAGVTDGASGLGASAAGEGGEGAAEHAAGSASAHAAGSEAIEDGGEDETSGRAQSDAGLPPMERCRLVIFQLQQASVTLLLDEDSQQWMQPLWYQHVSALLVPELQPVAALLAEQHTRMQALEEPYRFVYFNRHNLAVKGHMRSGSAGARSISAATSRMGMAAEPKQLLDRMHADLSTGGPLREVALHAGAHGWIVGRANTSRGFYLFLDGRDYSWSEVQSEVQALCAAHFGNIFLDG